MMGLIAILCVLNLFLPIIIPILSQDDVDPVGLSFVNPLVIYKNIDVNWFGCILITIIIHIILPFPAALYWLYKLCTVGRK